jgi:DNA-binding protein HU-beta
VRGDTDAVSNGNAALTAAIRTAAACDEIAGRAGTGPTARDDRRFADARRAGVAGCTKNNGTLRPMTNQQLVEAVSEKTEQGRSAVDAVVDAVLATITEALSSGERADLRGFGSFVVKEKKERQGRNPRTGETIKQPGGWRGEEMQHDTSPHAVELAGQETQGADGIGGVGSLADAVLPMLPHVSALRLQGISHRGAQMLRWRNQARDSRSCRAGISRLLPPFSSKCNIH